MAADTFMEKMQSNTELMESHKSGHESQSDSKDLDFDRADLNSNLNGGPSTKSLKRLREGNAGDELIDEDVLEAFYPNQRDLL